MLYYKNNRFYIGGISYALSKDICLVLDVLLSLRIDLSAPIFLF